MSEEKTYVIDRVALKKRAKQILDKKTIFLILCFAFYAAIVACCFAFCLFIPNPLEPIVVNFFLRATTTTFDDIWIEYITWGFFKFFRVILFFALIYPFSVCMATIPVAIVEEQKVTWASAFAPIKKARYFIEYMVTGASKFLYVFLWSILFIVPGIVSFYRHSLTKYVFAKENELTSGEALQKTKKLVLGYKTQLFTLDISFIGWFIFGICTCGVGMLYLVCYYSVTKVLYYKKICEIHQYIENQSNTN